MKKILFLFAAVALLAATSCDDPSAKTVSVTITVDDSSIEEGVPTPDSYVVSISNYDTGTSFSATTENGVAIVEGVLPGVYSVTATASVSKDGFAYTLSGSQKNVTISAESNSLTLEVAAIKESALIFKEIYYCGAKGDNYYFRDQFYEIYNNSDQVVYADGLCISTVVFANYDFSNFYEWDIPNPEKYVFAQVIWQLPGNGTDYPIQPGESFVIAQWATNHTDSTLSAGCSLMDLTGAEFEAFGKEQTLWNGITLTDEAALNMVKIVNTTGYDTPQWLTSVSGCGYILFKPSTSLRNDNYIAATNAATPTLAHEILIEDIIDAVETVSDETRMTTLGLPTVLDAGAIWLEGNYTGQSVSRKVASENENGIKKYQDSNNTTEDFVINETPAIRRNGAGVPSWNTWIK